MEHALRVLSQLRKSREADDASVPLSPRKLPIWDHSARLLRSVDENKVTLILGGTGCGKSTQVPQMLLEKEQRENPKSRSRIVCSQPRRLAAMAVAERVAQEHGSALGGEIGVHIGQRNESSNKTRVLFVSAGLLLEQIKQNGEGAFDDVSYLVIDEVHERSIESDLLLAAVRRMCMAGGKLRHLKIVLMSATLDLVRYQSFMKLGDDEHVKLIIVDLEQRPSSIGTLHAVEEIYLDEIDLHVDRLMSKHQGAAMVLLMARNAFARLENKIVEAESDPPSGYALDSDLHDACRAIVEANLKRGETSLVFLPTYRALEKQHEKLLSFLEEKRIHVLHSSIEIDECMRTLTCIDEAVVILATNVAESSLTIPNVVHVVDVCLSNEGRWDFETAESSARVVWASRAQSGQRKGRVGRVKSGTVWRLLPRHVFFSQQGMVPEFETPSIRLQSLAKPSLLLIATRGCKALNDPPKLFAETLDPPEPRAVEQSLSTLEKIGAMTTNTKKKKTYDATPYGRMLVDMPVSLDASRLAVALALRGATYAGALIAAIESTIPKPVVRPFGSSKANNYAANLRRYHRKGNSNDRLDELIAHAAAFEYYQSAFLDQERKHASLNDEDYQAREAAFCLKHALLASALRDVAATLEVILGVFHRYRPTFLKGHPPLYRSLVSGEEHRAGELFDDEIFRECADHVWQTTRDDDEEDEEEDSNACVYFARGTCARGASCRFTHDSTTRRSGKGRCTFFKTPAGCRFGSSCRFAHDAPQREESSFDFRGAVDRLNSRVEDEERRHSFDPFEPLLIFGEGDFGFTEALVGHFSTHHPRRPSSVSVIATAIQRSVPDRLTPRLLALKQAGVTVVQGVDATDPNAWQEASSKVLWNFPFNGADEDVAGNTELLAGFFRAARTERRPRLHLYVTLCNDQLLRWSVLKSAANNFFDLVDSFAFDFDAFPYQPVRNDLHQTQHNPFDFHDPVVYCFEYDAHNTTTTTAY